MPATRNNGNNGPKKRKKSEEESPNDAKRQKTTEASPAKEPVANQGGKKIKSGHSES